jgi:uncharacterized protein (DUF3820 family)
MTTYTDKSLMPFGKHKGTALANVPASYLLWIYDQPNFDKGSPLGVYIQGAKAAILLEIQRDKGLKR